MKCLNIYIVKPGDSIYTIASRYGVTPESIIEANGLENPSQLSVGEALVIPSTNTTHVVKSGETLFGIARQYGITLNELLTANPTLRGNSRIVPGQIIIIPARSQKLGTIEVNGYAFPNTRDDVIDKTLPNLTYLSIFSYTVNRDGTLNTINDTPLIQKARSAGVAPIMVVTNIVEGKGFDSDLVRAILTNNAALNNLINNIIATLNSKRYYGLNIDFEYIFPEDRENYNNFIKTLAPRLRSLGYILMTSLAPKTSATQRGLLYEAHDYPVHGSVVDRVILMTYEWGYTSGPPLPVAPLNEVQKVLNYAVTVIPANKILLGMPNYGYDWTLPYIRGTTAQTLPLTEAQNRAFRVNAQIKFDPIAQSPFYNYYDRDRKEHIVWFEDARSIRSKLRVVYQYKLAGVSYWTIGRFYPQNWIILNSMFNVKKVL